MITFRTGWIRMIRFWNAFLKITAWPLDLIVFTTKIRFEDRSVQGRHIHGPAILISNHTSIFDYAVWVFVFWTRTLRFQMAELLFKKPFLGVLLKWLGGIYVDRDAHNFGFITKSEAILRKGGIVGIFPESRIPRPEEERPLPFKPSAAYLALSTGVPVIPLYTDGVYFTKARAHVIIGKPMLAADYVDEALTEKENLERVTEAFRERIIELRRLADGEK